MAVVSRLERDSKPPALAQPCYGEAHMAPESDVRPVMGRLSITQNIVA